MSFLRPATMLRSIVRPMMARHMHMAQTSLHSLVRPVACVQPRSSARLYGSQSPVSAVTAQLTEALTQEIEAEKKLEVEQLGGEAPPTMPGFKVENDEAIVKLTKNYNNEKITVIFNVNHSVDMDDMDHEGAEHDDGTMTPIARPLFTVEIEKGNEKFCFELELADANDEHGQFDFRVEEFYIAPAGSGDIDPKVYSSSGKYIDQNLYDLLFLKFLEERGINAEFCDNLVRFATHYEHAQYVLLLQKIKSFVSK